MFHVFFSHLQNTILTCTQFPFSICHTKYIFYNQFQMLFYFVSFCTVSSSLFAISLTAFSVEIMSYCCFLRIFSLCSVFIVLFHNLPELCHLAFISGFCLILSSLKPYVFCFTVTLFHSLF